MPHIRRLALVVVLSVACGEATSSDAGSAGGGSSATGGGSSATGGGSSATGGGSSASGGGGAATGGGGSATGGGGSATGGGGSATGGGGSATGGGGSATGGGGSATGGGGSATGGGGSATGGGGSATGGGGSSTGGGGSSTGGGGSATGGGGSSTGGGGSSTGGGGSSTGGGGAGAGGGGSATGGGGSATGGGGSATGGGGSATGGGGATPSNVLFVTSSTYTGALGGVAQADAICQAHAADAGFSGVFRAWLGATAVSAPAHLGSARGWRRSDGQPVFDTIDRALSQLEIFYPPMLDEHGVSVTGSVWTGTNADGGVAANCFDWSISDAGASGVIGVPNHVSSQWTESSPLACTYKFPLYCFGVSQQVPVAPVAPTPHRIVFLTTGLYVLDGGLAQADALCTSEAADAGLTGAYRALLSTTTTSAWSRFDTVGGTWTRVDGAAPKPTAAALLAVDGGALDCALNLTARGAYLTATGGATWSGSATPAVTGTNNCTNWSSTSVFAGGTGWVDIVAPTWFNFPALGSVCSAPHRMYCLQQQ